MARKHKPEEIIASETLCRRARSAVFAPASASFGTPMICSSENLRASSSVLPSGQTLIALGRKSVGHVTGARHSAAPEDRLKFGSGAFALTEPTRRFLTSGRQKLIRCTARR